MKHACAAEVVGRIAHNRPCSQQVDAQDQRGPMTGHHSMDSKRRLWYPEPITPRYRSNLMSQRQDHPRGRFCTLASMSTVDRRQRCFQRRRPDPRSGTASHCWSGTPSGAGNDVNDRWMMAVSQRRRPEVESSSPQNGSSLAMNRAGYPQSATQLPVKERSTNKVSCKAKTTRIH